MTITNIIIVIGVSTDKTTYRAPPYRYPVHRGLKDVPICDITLVSKPVYCGHLHMKDPYVFFLRTAGFVWNPEIK